MVIYRAGEPVTRILASLEMHEPEDEAVAKEFRLRAEVLGLFLSRQLHNRGLSPKQFASILGLDKDITEAILEGWFPVSEIADDLLVDIARAIGFSPNILRIVAGRKICPLSSQQREISDKTVTTSF